MNVSKTLFGSCEKKIIKLKYINDFILKIRSFILILIIGWIQKNMV